MKVRAVEPTSFREFQLQTELLSNTRLSYQKQWFYYRLALILNDAVSVLLGFILAFIIRFETNLPIFQLDVVPSFPFYSTVTILIVPVWLIVFWAAGLYNRQSLLGGIFEYTLVFRSVSIGVLLVIILGFLGPEFVFARGWLILSWGFVFLITISGRFILRHFIYRLRRLGYFTERAILIGGNEEAERMAEQIHDRSTSGLHLVGFVSERVDGDGTLIGSVPCLGEISQIDTIIQNYHPEEVIVATSSLPRETILQLFKQYGFSSEVNFRMSSGLYELITTGIQVSEFASVPLVKLNKVRLTGMDEIFKNILDYGLTIPGLIVISPILLFIAVMIRIDSPGPIIHRRRVMGVNGSQFDAFKFRTMVVNGDEVLSKYPELQKELAENHKLKDDPRITRIGKVLRKFSLDELPQLFNVLRHEMSLVGPRMISPPEMEKYNQWGVNLLTVRPGITGLWQVSGRSDIQYEDRVRLDMYYIRNWTVWLDLVLLLKTIPAALSSRGAY